MNSLSLNGLSLRQALALIAEGHCAPVDVINACYDQIEARQADVGPGIFCCRESSTCNSTMRKRRFIKPACYRGCR